MESKYTLLCFTEKIKPEPIKCYFPNCQEKKVMYAQFLCKEPYDENRGKQFFKPLCAKHMDLMQKEVKQHGGYSIWR